MHMWNLLLSSNDTLLTAMPKQQWRPFRAAAVFAQSLKLTSQPGWKQWCKSGARPADIPATPHKVYAGSGWQGYGHWLGTGNESGGVKQQWRPFGAAAAFAQSLGLISKTGKIRPAVFK